MLGGKAGERHPGIENVDGRFVAENEVPRTRGPSIVGVESFVCSVGEYRNHLLGW